MPLHQTKSLGGLSQTLVYVAHVTTHSLHKSRCIDLLTLHVTERYAFSTSLRNKTSNLITSNLWLPGHHTIGWAVWANFHAQHEVSTRADWRSPPPPHIPDQCGYACLLCLNSGSVAPLVGLPIMMLRIISCSVKGYTSLSLDTFVPKHQDMHECVFVWPYFSFSCNMQHILTTLTTGTE